MPVKHRKTSTVPNALNDTRRIGGDDWNNEHDVDLGVSDITGLEERLIPTDQVVQYRDDALAYRNQASGFADDAAESATEAAATLSGKASNSDLADATDAGKGAGRIGFAAALAYPAGTVGAFLKTLVVAATLAAANGAGLVGFLQAGANAVLRTLLGKSQDTISVFDFMTTAQIADVLSGAMTLDHTVPVQNAINASYGKRLLWPYGAYNCGQLTLPKAFCWRGEMQALNPYSYVGKVAKLNFASLVTAGQAAIIIGGGTDKVSGISMEGFAIYGNSNIDCIQNGGGINGSVTDASFKDILIYGFRTGISQSFIYDATFSNVRVQNCVNGILNGNQTNCVLFSRCAVVSGTGKALEHINCEGIHYDTCDISNQTQATAPITLFQSAVTFTNLYPENITADIAIIVGTGVETFPSSLQMINPVKFGKIIQAGRGTVVDVSGGVRSGVQIISADIRTPYAFGRVRGARDEEPKTNRLIRRVPANSFPRFVPYSSATLTYTPNRGYTTVNNSASAATGVQLASANLTVGVLYTLHLAMRLGSGTPATGVAFRHGATNLGVTPDASGAVPTVRKYSFIATDPNFFLAFTGELDLFGFFFEEGNESDPMLDTFATSAVDAYVGEATAGPAPTVGTWRAGDELTYTNVTITNPLERRRCSVAGTPGTWVAVDWQIFKGTTAQRPTLGAGDIGVTYLDTTLAAAGKLIVWGGTAWNDMTGASPV